MEKTCALDGRTKMKIVERSVHLLRLSEQDEKGTRGSEKGPVSSLARMVLLLHRTCHKLADRLNLSINCNVAHNSGRDHDI